jgi:hypothetical protein
MFGFGHGARLASVNDRLRSWRRSRVGSEEPSYDTRGIQSTTKSYGLVPYSRNCVDAANRLPSMHVKMFVGDQCSRLK